MTQLVQRRWKSQDLRKGTGLRYVSQWGCWLWLEVATNNKIVTSAKIILIVITSRIEQSFFGTSWEGRGGWVAIGLPLGNRLKRTESKDGLLLLLLLFSLLSSLLPINLQILSSSIFFPPHLRHAFILPSSCHLFLNVSSPPGQPDYSGSTLQYFCCPRSTMTGIWKHMVRKSIFVPIITARKARPTLWSWGHFSSLGPDPV